MRLFFPSAPSNSRHVRFPGIFPDDRFSASFSLDDTSSNGRPERAVLNNKTGSWCSLYKRENEWLELDLGSDQTIYGVAVQGSHNSDNKVINYNISLRSSDTGEGAWIFLQVSNFLCILALETEQNTVNSGRLSTAVPKVINTVEACLQRVFYYPASLYGTEAMPKLDGNN